MSKKRKFFPTVHSIERAREYFGVNELRAVDFVNDLAEKAVHLMIQPDTKRRITYNEEHDVKLVLGPNDNTVITILPPGKPKHSEVIPAKAVSVGNAIIEKARAVIQRELTKSRRQFTAEYRALSLEQAELAVEIAQANVKKVRCKAPHTKALIQERIDALKAYHQTIDAKLVAIKDEHERMAAEALAFVGSEVDV